MVKVTLYCGDNIDSLKRLAANSVDSIVTDPPYGLSQQSPEDITNALTAWVGGKEYLVKKKGFMGKTWDSFVPGPELWKEVYRVLKPGGHVLCFAGSRTDDLMGIALRMGGFEIRDKIMWIYGTGFPKSHNISKAIDTADGVERVVVGISTNGRGASPSKIDNHGVGDTGIGHADGSKQVYEMTAATSDAAKQWDGWGTALKPAFEPIIVARKPLSEKTVASNVLKHGTGGINVDGCRVALTEGDDPRLGGKGAWTTQQAQSGDTVTLPRGTVESSPLGRFPANVVHDGSDEVEEAFSAFGDKKSCMSPSSADSPGTILGGSRAQGNLPMDEGTASRFFYSAKANKADRADSKHPTVKPVALMRYLVRLVTPPGGVTLDPFAGSGTTGSAAVAEGFNAILMERETEYQNDIEKRFVGNADVTFKREVSVEPAKVPVFYDDDE